MWQPVLVVTPWINLQGIFAVETYIGENYLLNNNWYQLLIFYLKVNKFKISLLKIEFMFVIQTVFYFSEIKYNSSLHN